MPKIIAEEYLDEYFGDEEAPSEFKLHKLVAEYEVLVFTLAMHLTGSEDAARQVVETVFVRLNREWTDNIHESLENVIHKLTYEEALPLLLAQIETKNDEQDALIFKLAQGSGRLVC